MIRNIKMRDCVGLCRWALHAITSVLIRKAKRETIPRKEEVIYTDW